MKVYSRFTDAVQFEIVDALGEYVGDFDVEAIADEDDFWEVVPAPRTVTIPDERPPGVRFLGAAALPQETPPCPPPSVGARLEEALESRGR